MSNCQVLIVIVSMMLSGLCFAGEITREGALELMDECQRQRQISIAPPKEQAIQNCVTNQRRDREYCEAYYKNFGERNPRIGWGLPVCEQAVAAERHFSMNPRSQVYNSP